MKQENAIPQGQTAHATHDFKELGAIAKEKLSEKGKETLSDVKEAVSAVTIPFAKKAAEFREKATAVGHDLQDLKNITKELTADALHVITENASGYYDQGIKKAKTLEESLERNIQQNPVRYLLIAAGVGLVAGAVLLRRTKKEG